MGRVIIEHLVKAYQEKEGPLVTAVNGISLTVEPGEFMVLVGPSGCGKSTTLRMIAGLEELTGGTISIDGRVVNHVPPKDRDIAMVFQNYALYPHLSVYDNLAFGLRLRKVPKPEIAARVQAAAVLLGLEPYLQRKPKALSGGQRQRVAVGRAIVRQPKVFLFDEPLSNLDAKMRAATRAEISKLHARLGATMIYVTHDQVEAMTMGDRICVMQDGRIIQVAEPLELYHRPNHRFVAGFMGSPPMNLFEGRIERAGGGGLLFAEAPGTLGPGFRLEVTGALARLAEGQAGRPVTLGVRPEDVHDPAEPGWAGRPGAIQGRLDLAEPMGAETYLHLSTASTSVIARVHSERRRPPEEPTEVILDLARAHLFDGASGAALGHCAPVN